MSALGIAVSAAFTSFQLSPGVRVDEFPKFFWGMIAIFFFTGVGNASTFKQMPMIFAPRQAGGVIGWTAAIAAFGPFVFGLMFATGYTQALYWLGVVVAPDRCGDHAGTSTPSRARRCPADDRPPAGRLPGARAPGDPPRGAS